MTEPTQTFTQTSEARSKTQQPADPPPRMPACKERSAGKLRVRAPLVYILLPGPSGEKN